MSTVIEPAESATAAPPATRWALPTRVAFRLCFLYFGIYVLITQMLGGSS